MVNDVQKCPRSPPRGMVQFKHQILKNAVVLDITSEGLHSKNKD